MYTLLLKQIQLFFLLYLITILLLVVLPLNSSGELNDVYVIHIRADYLGHLTMFIPWAFFQGLYSRKVLPWLGLGLVFAAFSEGLQYFIPYRAYNINDLLANVLGVLIGWGMMLLYARLRKSKL